MCELMSTFKKMLTFQLRSWYIISIRMEHYLESRSKIRKGIMK